MRFGKPRQEPGDRLGRLAAKLDRGLRCRRKAASQSSHPLTGIGSRQRFAGRGVDSLECFRGFRGTPRAADENRILSHQLDNDDRITQHADRRDLDFDDIVLVQREIVGRHDACAGQQHRAWGKTCDRKR